MNNTIFSLTPPTLTHCHTLRSARQPRCTTQCSGSIYLPLFPSQSSSDHTNTFAAFRITHRPPGGQQPLGLRLALRPQNLRYGFGASFAIPAASSASAAGGVGVAYLPLATFTEPTFGSWNCNPCTLDPTAVGEVDVYNLFQEGPFAVTIHSIVAVTEPQANVWSDAGLDARLRKAGAIAAEIQGTIARGAYVYDKGYQALCVALYLHTASALAAITGGSVAGTEPAAKRVLCNALTAASGMAAADKTDDAAWAIRRGFDAVLAIVDAADKGGVYTSAAAAPTPSPTPSPSPAPQCRTMIDVRDEADYRADNAGCTANILITEFGAGQPGLSKVLALVRNDKTAAVGVHCYRGNRAGQVKAYLEANGFTNVENDGGWVEEKAAIVAKCAAVDECNGSYNSNTKGNQNAEGNVDEGRRPSPSLPATNAAAEELAAATVKALPDAQYPQAIQGDWLFTGEAANASNADLVHCGAKHSGINTTSGGGMLVDGIGEVDEDDGIAETGSGNTIGSCADGRRRDLWPLVIGAAVAVFTCN